MGRDPGHPLGVNVVGEVPETWKMMWGVEFDFIVLDSADHAAVFSTAGFGPMPFDVVGHWDEEVAAVERLARLPVTSAADLTAAATGDCSDWQSFAARGLFAYDYDNQSQRVDRYQLIAAPDRPNSAAELEPFYGSERRPARIPGSFEDTRQVFFSHVEFAVIPGWGADLRA